MEILLADKHSRLISPTKKAELNKEYPLLTDEDPRKPIPQAPRQAQGASGHITAINDTLVPNYEAAQKQAREEAERKKAAEAAQKAREKKINFILYGTTVTLVLIASALAYLNLTKDGRQILYGSLVTYQQWFGDGVKVPYPRHSDMEKGNDNSGRVTLTDETEFEVATKPTIGDDGLINYQEPKLGDKFSFSGRVRYITDEKGNPIEIRFGVKRNENK